jgi:hypothetical protein
MAKKSASQEDFEALINEVARLEVDLLRLTHANRSLVLGLNNAWEVLDRLTGRKPDPLRDPHVHDFKVVRPAVFCDRAGNARGEGVTEVCECGSVRSRVMTWICPEELKA